jgi:hypothetical protein
MAKEELGVTTTLSGVVGVPSTYDGTGYAALTFAKIGEVTGLTTLGGSGQVTEFIPLETGEVEKMVGSINYGDTTVTFGKDFTDAGQIFLAAAFDGASARQTCSFKLTFPSGKIFYFTAKVSSDTVDGFDPNTVMTGQAVLNITSKIVKV